jgi:acyl-CoA thioesterase-1
MRPVRIITAGRIMAAALTFAAMLSFSRADAASGTIVALGASNTYGKGVARNQAYPAQLEAILRAKGHTVRVINAGINGNTTRQMLARMDSAVPKGASVVILQPGGNDRRKGEGGDTGQNVAEIQSRLGARGVRVVMMENSMFRSLPKQPDGQHMTPEGYRMLAEAIAGQVEGSLGR